MAKKKDKKVSVENLNIKKTPMLGRNVSKRVIGKKLGLSITYFIHDLFSLNERLPPSKRMTDGEIARQIRNEYGHDDRCKERFSELNPQLSHEIAKLRSEYNRGRLITSSPPPTREMVSFCYNEEGQPVNPRFKVPRPLTKAQQEKVRDKYKRYRDEWSKQFDG